MNEQERRIEERLRRKVDELGGTCWKITPVRGAPDRIVLLAGITYFVELKKPGGRLAKAQKYVQECLRSQGFAVYTLWCDDDVDSFIDDIRKNMEDGL